MKPDETEEFILLMIDRDTKILRDGYRRYIAAQKVGMELVPIIYEK
ncbi:hypothetical protein IFT92_27155 [Peribacillus simplex]|nr:hypothetical protein [Peribacillus simplex]